MADHERSVRETLRRLALAQAPVLAAGEGGRCSGPAGIVWLVLPGWQLLLADVAPGPRAALSDASRLGGVRLDGVGRYGRFWWIHVVGGGPGHEDSVTLLGSHLRLVPDAGGGRVPAGLGPPSHRSQQRGPSSPRDLCAAKGRADLGAPELSGRAPAEEIPAGPGLTLLSAEG